ncbi:MAG: hypothetical protein R8K48_07365 [Gallionella sp.]
MNVGETLFAQVIVSDSGASTIVTAAILVSAPWGAPICSASWPSHN